MEVTFQSDNVYFDKVQVHSRELEEGETDADLYSGPNYDVGKVPNTPISVCLVVPPDHRHAKRNDHGAPFNGIVYAKQSYTSDTCFLKFFFYRG